MLSAINTAGPAAVAVSSVSRFSCVIRRRPFRSFIQVVRAGLAPSGPDWPLLPQPRGLQSILLETPVECAPAQTERLGGFARIAIVARQSFFDKEGFDLFQAHFFQATGIAGRCR